ncbi:MAG: hypothetical protein SH809_01385 [Rhodothermales bacterium]|nr:hypothetical protein [Rhodothermales bacterium]
MPFSRHALGAIVFLILLPCTRTAGAQPGRPYTLEAPLADTLRALIVFTRFADDPDPGNADLDFTGWPASSSALPTFAQTLLTTSPQPPYADSTLTAYFHRQSLGRFVIFGEPYDSVLVAAHPEARYHSPQGGYGDLTVELLTRIDAGGFDFSRYDHNRDGVVDQIFIVIRGDTQRDAKRFTWTGASCLDGRCAGAYTQRMAIPPLILDGVRVDWNTSGSFIMHRTPGNIIPQPYHVRLMAHELGHDLWAPFFVHIPTITRNDVPATSNRSPKGHCVGYVLMAGAGGAMDCGGHQTVSAFERDLLGWIECRPLTTSQTGLRLDDLYTSDACFRVDLDDERTIYLTNHQRIGPFDRYRQAGRRTVFEMGLLRTSGLLVTLADGYRLDVIPADNSLDLGVTNDVYAGDMFGPGTRRQLTPWTRPNSNGFTRQPRNIPMRWFAIDDIRFSPGPEQVMVFDFIADAREHALIREESWMGLESNALDFAGGIEIRDRSTLHIEGEIVVSGMIRVGPGSTLDITPGASLRIATTGKLHLSPGSAIVLSGELILEGPLHVATTATITREGAGRISGRIR